MSDLHTPAVSKALSDRTSGEDMVRAFTPGDRVRYVPRHAYGDQGHPDCENGIVSSVNDEFVFVRYYASVQGALRETAQATYPRDLVRS